MAPINQNNEQDQNNNGASLEFITPIIINYPFYCFLNNFWQATK